MSFNRVLLSESLINEDDVTTLDANPEVAYAIGDNELRQFSAILKDIANKKDF